MVEVSKAFDRSKKIAIGTFSVSTSYAILSTISSIEYSVDCSLESPIDYLKGIHVE